MFTAGITPLQQYLLYTGNGKLQVPDIAWDVINKRWFHLYPNEETDAGNGMHWTGSYKNWNSRCAECHATDYRKNYDPLKDSYNSQQAEIGVGCEACHGPGSAHLVWADSPEKFSPELWQDVNTKGLTAAYKKDDAASQIRNGIREAIRAKSVTYDLARQIEGATEVTCSEFARRIVEKMRA